MCGHGCKCGCLVRAAVAIGLTWAIWVFVAGVLAMHGYGLPMVKLMGSVYLGYSASIKGSLFGALWGFVDVFLFVIVVGGVYCLISRGCHKHDHKCCASGECKAEENNKKM